MKKASSLWYINEVVDKLRDKEDSDYYIQSLKRHVLNIRNYLNNNISDFKDTGRELLPVLPDRLPGDRDSLTACIEKTGEGLLEKGKLLRDLISISCPSGYFEFLDCYVNKEVPRLALTSIKGSASIISGLNHRTNIILTEQFKKANKTQKEISLTELQDFYRLKKEDKLFAEKNHVQKEFLDYFKEKLCSYRECELLSAIEQCSEIERYFEDSDKTRLDKASELLYQSACNRIRFEVLMRKFNQYDGDSMSESYLSIGYPFIKASSLKDELDRQGRKSAILALIPFFNVLSEAEIEKISSRIKMKRYDRNTVLFREGDSSEEVFIIKSGTVKIYNDTRDFVTLDKGDMFGELGVISDGDRSLSAMVTSEKSDIYVISKSDFLYMLERYPVLITNLTKILCNRLDRATVRLINYLRDYSVSKEIIIKKKSDLPGTIPLLKVLSVTDMERISSRIKLKKYYWNTVLFNEGDMADNVYIIKTGTINIYKHDSGNIREFSILTDGDVFGEMGVISDTSRSLSARVASEKAELYVISKHDFLYMMDVYPDLSLNVAEILCERINNNTEKLLHCINKDKELYI